MKTALVTGSNGLIGSAACLRFAQEGHHVVGVDNDMRAYFFGSNASTLPRLEALRNEISGFEHHSLDIRDGIKVMDLFSKHGANITAVIHTAAQPSHDWATREPATDFSINATGTLNVLEACRTHCPEAVFIFTSTNKVYGDTPNSLPLVELANRWEIDPSHQMQDGIDESMSIDQTKHSLFGCSKAAADLLVQEYGRYFGLKTVCFRAGCLTGQAHAGAELHGFLAYLIKCTRDGTPYVIHGYKGKQVRDNIHADDLAEAFWQFYLSPRTAEVYNIGGGRYSNCSMIEAIQITEAVTHKKLAYTYSEISRAGDHIWWISNCFKFRSHYPQWNYRYDLLSMIRQIASKQ